MQKHDIVKKRIDYQGNVIDSRPDGIGSTEVYKSVFFFFFFFALSFQLPFTFLDSFRKAYHLPLFL